MKIPRPQLSPFFRVHFLYAIIIYLTSSTLNPVLASSHPLGGSGAHFCGFIDNRWNKRYKDQHLNRHYARSSVANLNVGEPHTVRLIYFLPNDRPYRDYGVQWIKRQILRAQSFYTEQMARHGYENLAFRIETDSQGEPKVHRVDGAHPDSHYLIDTPSAVEQEISQVFDLRANVYLILIDNSTAWIHRGDRLYVAGVGTRISKSGGYALIATRESSNLTAHELGHAFGLQHDFRNSSYLMAYGPTQVGAQLSQCHADYLSVHPHFNLNIPLEDTGSPKIEFISPGVDPVDSQNVPARLQISDLEGLHQLFLFKPTTERFANTFGFPEVVSCRGLAGDRDAVVLMDYADARPSDSWSERNGIRVDAVDTDGNVESSYFTVGGKSPHHRVTRWEGHAGRVYSGAFSPDSLTLATSGEDGVKLWDVATQQNIAIFSPAAAREISTGSIMFTFLAFSPDGSILATATAVSIRHERGTGWGIVTELWDVATQQNIGTLPLAYDRQAGAYVESSILLAFSPDGTTLAGVAEHSIELWDVATQQNIATLKGHVHVVDSVAFSPTGKLLASGAADRTVKLWDVGTQQNIATLKGHTRVVLSVAFSPNGKLLASGAWDNTVKLWDVTTKQNIATLPHTDAVDSVAFSPNGELLASGSWDNTVKLWDVATKQNIATLANAGTGNFLFSPDGTTLAAGTGYSIELWDVATKQNIAPLPLAHKERISFLAFSPDGASLAAGGAAGRVGLWNLSELTVIRLDTTAEIGITMEGQLAAADVNRDGWVNVLDLIVVAQSFGEQPPSNPLADTNKDGAVNLLDLVFVAGHLSQNAAAPIALAKSIPSTAKEVTAAQRALTELEAMPNKTPHVKIVIELLRHYLSIADRNVQETELLLNYPNPFNPDTWIPYQLAEGATVTVKIYDVTGSLVRTINVGHKPVGYYLTRERAVYWNGRNESGEPVSSGVYFYTLNTDTYTQTRRMVIVK